MTTTEIENDSNKINSDHLQKFSLRGLPLLSQGQSTIPLVTSNNLWISSKVYSEGGERHLHAHLENDHAFFVLSGAMRVYDENDNIMDVEKYEGFVIPAGVSYRFDCISEGNLVMLRMAGSAFDYFTINSKYGHTKGSPKGDAVETSDLMPIESGELFEP